MLLGVAGLVVAGAACGSSTVSYGHADGGAVISVGPAQAVAPSATDRDDAAQMCQQWDRTLRSQLTAIGKSSAAQVAEVLHTPPWLTFEHDGAELEDAGPAYSLLRTVSAAIAVRAADPEDYLEDISSLVGPTDTACRLLG